MHAQLTFLGTAGDASTMGKQLLASGGIILLHDHLQLHIDPGPGSLVQYPRAQLSVRNTDIIMTTQDALLYAHDVHAVVQGMTVGGLDRKGVFIHGPIAYKSIHKEYLTAIERTISLQHTDTVGINEVTIYPFINEQHTAYIIDTQEYKVGISGPKLLNKQSVAFFKGVDILVVYASPTYTIEQLGDFIDTISPRLVVLTHFSIKMMQDTLYYARTLQRNTAVQCIAAKDLLTLNPMSYRQKEKQTLISGIN
ncbi:MAG: hypothetical protein ACMXYC_04970 [Candidatus Woesearchaeota archaeon]